MTRARLRALLTPLLGVEDVASAVSGLDDERLRQRRARSHEGLDLLHLLVRLDSIHLLREEHVLELARALGALQRDVELPRLNGRRRHPSRAAAQSRRTSLGHALQLHVVELPRVEVVHPVEELAHVRCRSCGHLEQVAHALELFAGNGSNAIRVARE